MASTQDDQPPPTSLPSSSSTLPPPEYDVVDFKHNLEAALDVVTPRVFAAITTLSEAPNPLLQAVKRFEEGGIPYERIGLGLPLQESQIQEFRIMRLLVQDQRLGGEAIRSKDLEILNVKWTTWIQSSVERLVGEKFGIRGTTVHFEGALVVTDKKAAQFFANDFSEAKDNNGFGKVLAILPSFRESKLTISTPKSGEVCTSEQNLETTGDLTLAIWRNGAEPKLTSPACLSLLYSISVTEPKKCLPDQDKSLRVVGLGKCLNSWLAAARIENLESGYPNFVTWVLEDDYGTFDDIHGVDRERADMLFQAAKDHGFKCYYVTLIVEDVGSAGGHQEDEESEEGDFYDGSGQGRHYKSPKYHAEVNPDGSHWMIDNKETFAFECWKDLRNSQCLDIHTRWTAKNDKPTPFSMLPERNWVETKGKPGSTFKEDYDPDAGSLVWKWKRSALVMWPEEKHCQIFVDLFGPLSQEIGDPDTSRAYLSRMVEYHQVSYEAAPDLTVSIPQQSYNQSQNNIQPHSFWISENAFLLFRQIVEAKELDLMAIILKKILGIDIPKFPNQQAEFQFFVTIMDRISEELLFVKIPPDSHPAISHFFQTIVLKYILPTLGTAPEPKSSIRSNWSLPELKCETNCEDCRSVSVFLVSPLEEGRTWCLIKSKRTHIMSVVNNQYSRSENLMLSETHIQGRVGVLSMWKVGMTRVEKFQAWESKRETIHKPLTVLRDWFGVSKCARKIFEAVVKGGQGYTTAMKRMAEEWLAEPFPMTASKENQPPVVTVPMVDIPFHNSPLPSKVPAIQNNFREQEVTTAFLGYGFVYFDDVVFDVRPADTKVILELLSKFQQNLGRLESKYAIKVNIHKNSLQRFVNGTPHSQMPTQNPTGPLPGYLGISKLGPNFDKFVVQDGKHRLLALKGLLNQLKHPVTRNSMSEEEKTQGSWWLAEIYDTGALDRTPELYTRLGRNEITLPSTESSVSIPPPGGHKRSLSKVGVEGGPRRKKPGMSMDFMLSDV
ncbi:hypothetical protein BDD12DRAFT_803081 [Trichophaea hybrida]|nr:hypothetical protein BDD12DRAFT_803081 [Trichophaea hybrida]